MVVRKNQVRNSIWCGFAGFTNLNNTPVRFTREFFDSGGDSIQQKFLFSFILMDLNVGLLPPLGI